MAEPWLRGERLPVDPTIEQVLFALQQAEEDLGRWTDGLTDQQIWQPPHGLAPIGFQLGHIAGSLERLTVYLEGGSLSDEQLAASREEMTPGPSREALIAGFQGVLDRTRQVLQELRPEQFGEPRYVGRMRIQTTAIGLAIHMAEHTQRHVGQAIVTARLLGRS